MEQDVENGYRTVCSTCLSSDRNLFDLDIVPQIHEIFKLLMYDFAGDRLGEMPDLSHLICWECLAVMKRFLKFKWQVHNAQEHIRVLALSQSHETMDHTYMSQSLSSLAIESKSNYDQIYFEYSVVPEYVSTDLDIKNEQYGSLKDPMGLELEEHVLDVPEVVYSHVVLDASTLVSVSDAFGNIKTEAMPRLTIAPMTSANLEAGTVITSNQHNIAEAVQIASTQEIVAKRLLEVKPDKADGTIIISTKIEEPTPKPGYFTEYMTEADMLETREMAKKKVQYASSVYKCELCAIGFYTQQQVEDHFETAHRPKPGTVACKVCYQYVSEASLSAHTDQHYLRYTCKLCSKSEHSVRLMQLHVRTHSTPQPPPAVIRVGGKSKKKKKEKNVTKDPPKPGDLRKLLSKTTIEGYKCLECDMFFKNSRARKIHVERYHREGLQCDHCQKRFVNRNTLATHLKLHEGPLPRSECPICHKMVRVTQLKYHVRRHQTKGRYECADCRKIFSHLATYHAHLKYSRAHADDNVFKFPCPMCNKGYPTKEQMQDHFNYQHLGKTAHKCPICDKPISSRANVEKHITRVHAEKKQKPKTHVCQTCGKSFADKKSLTQHEVIHSGLRPLSCDICQQTFKQKASLYTHRKRIHKVFPAKKQVHYMDDYPISVSVSVSST